jgi:O-methyltransferase
LPLCLWPLPACQGSVRAVYDHLTVSSPTRRPCGAILTGGTSRSSPGTSRKPAAGWKGKTWCSPSSDTDNPTPASAALEVARERTVPGGAIVFDHFTGTGRFRYTLGERIAGHALLGDPRWLHLHGTGVFYRQQASR